MRGDVHDALDIDSGVKITRHVFDAPEDLILASIAFDTLPAFALSDEGKEFLSDQNLIVPLEGEELVQSVRKTRTRMRATQFAI